MYKVLSYIIAAPLYLLSLMPRRVHYMLSDCICFILKSIVHYRQAVIYTNISRAFPSYSYAEVRRAAADYYRVMADLICESIWALGKKGSTLRAKGFVRVDAEGEAAVREAFSKGRPVVVLMSHSGNWEMISGLPGYFENSPLNFDGFACAYRPLTSKLSDELFKRLRNSRVEGGDILIPSARVLRQVISHKDESRLYFFISDQFPGHNASIETQFLGIDTTWFNGGESVARKLATPVLYAYMDRVSRGEYVFRFEPICADASQTAPGDIMNIFSRRLEKDIRNNPSNWLWSHKRWKNIGHKQQNI